jgi:hypothetical protein
MLVTPTLLICTPRHRLLVQGNTGRNASSDYGTNPECVSDACSEGDSALHIAHTRPGATRGWNTFAGTPLTDMPRDNYLTNLDYSNSRHIKANGYQRACCCKSREPV